MPAEPHSEASAPAVGPLFVSGRQHSGNTVTTLVFEQVPECLAVNREGWFFESRGLVERTRDPEARAAAILDLLRLPDEAVTERTGPDLAAWCREHPEAPAVDAYREAMRHATAACGRRFWVRRATSYIFYAEEILTLMPEARFLYLLRNPYDVCASLKRRAPRADRYVGWMVSWNRGVRLAETLQARYPDRFLIVKYEEMVSAPVEVFSRLFGFVGVPFDERYLDVPHVNRSEAHQTRTSGTRGFNRSRVYYYPRILKGPEIAALDVLVSRSRLAAHYPDLPHRSDPPGAGARILALGLIAVSPIVYAGQQLLSIMRGNPLRRAHRLLRRAGIG